AKPRTASARTRRQHSSASAKTAFHGLISLHTSPSSTDKNASPTQPTIQIMTGRDVADRILVAEQPGDDHQQQHAARERARSGGERCSQTTLGLAIDMPGEKPVLGTQKQGETNERQRDGRPGAPYIEGERKRQIVALPEAVRGGGSGSGEAENKRQASEELAPAPRHNRYRGCISR